jgi:2-polyprenyl-3-methyl-5-hydroxy-6-metoxy-1,4-benzoquinol methylase
MWLPEEDQYDLLLTSMEMHHCNSEEDLLRKYIRTLQPDGALVGCTLAEGTLTELHWAYSMAENERHGGNSPKVMHFSGLGDVGSFMTAAKFQLVTILAHE